MNYDILFKVAIRDIFGQYGKIVSMYYSRNASSDKWTFITYGTYREAELAIRELNNKKPLCLRVTLKRSSNGRSQNSCISQYSKEKMLATDIEVAPQSTYIDKW